MRGLKGVSALSCLPLCTALHCYVLQVQPFIRPLREWIRIRKVELGLIPDTGAGGSRGGGAARAAAAGSAGKQGRSGASSRGGAPPRVSQGGAAAAAAGGAAAEQLPLAGAAVAVEATACGLAAAVAEPSGRVTMANFRFDREAIMRCLMAQS